MNLDKILDSYGGVGHPKPISKREAKQALLDLLLDEVIGNTQSVGTVEFEGQEAKLLLDITLRQKLKELFEGK